MKPRVFIIFIKNIASDSVRNLDVRPAQQHCSTIFMLTSASGKELEALLYFRTTLRQNTYQIYYSYWWEVGQALDDLFAGLHFYFHLTCILSHR